jgi:hypothetical protein
VTLILIVFNKFSADLSLFRRSFLREKMEDEGIEVEKLGSFEGERVGGPS